MMMERLLSQNLPSVRNRSQDGAAAEVGVLLPLLQIEKLPAPDEVISDDGDRLEERKKYLLFLFYPTRRLSLLGRRRAEQDQVVLIRIVRPNKSIKIWGVPTEPTPSLILAGFSEPQLHRFQMEAWR
jgi:hypothetical protein